MSEHWSADCTHVNVTVNATMVKVVCKQYETELDCVRIVLLWVVWIYCAVLLYQNARLRKQVEEHDSLRKQLMV